MPAAWSRKDERQYEHIVSGCTRSRKVCKRIAAATVNKRRAAEVHTFSAVLVPALTESQSRKRIAELRRSGCAVTSRETPAGTVVYKKCPGLGEYAVEARAIPGNPRTGGWSPGWNKACSKQPLLTRADAQAYAKKIKVAGAKYRVVKGASPRCGGDTASALLLLAPWSLLAILAASLLKPSAAAPTAASKTA